MYQRVNSVQKALRQVALVAGLLALLDALPVAGQAAPAVPADAPAAEQPAPAEGMNLFGAKVVIHGFLSQAYAFSNGSQILGIPKQGTTDYNTAALQVRADMTTDDTFAIQLSHERVGLSPVGKTLPEVAVEWLFYEHHFGNSSLKVGRVKVPYGIYNEVRAVGTVLPFYRTARDFYGSGAFTTETVDGALVSHDFDLGKSWSLSGDLYYGNWTLFDTGQNEIRATKSIGTQVFLDTPISGLRLGLGTLRFDASTSTPVPTTPATFWHDVHGSIQETFGRVDGEVEYKNQKADLPSGRTIYDITAAYARIGVHLTEKWILNGQYEIFKLQLGDYPQLGNFNYDQDKTLALAYKPRLDLVVKAEYHWNRGYFLEPQGNVFGPSTKTSYGILSLSASF